MATNLNLDTQLQAVANIGSSSVGWADRVYALLQAGFAGASNPFGSAATLDAGGANGVAQLDSEGKVPSAQLPDDLVGVPPGAITMFGGTAIPNGWVACNGASYSRSDATYSQLFAAIGVSYGSDNASTFRVPNFQRRIPLGTGGTRPQGSNGPGTTPGSIGGGEADVQVGSGTTRVTNMPPTLTVNFIIKL